ncbi:MAG: putative quinol monooxygenase [Sphingomonadaceae bacterium]|jgi:quinol monooxygenase YgiN
MRKSFIAKLVAKPDKAADLEALQTELRQLVHAHEPDCEVYELFKAADAPFTYFCIATFKSEAAFDYHMNIDFHDRLVPPILECLAQEMELSFHEAV